MLLSRRCFVAATVLGFCFAALASAFAQEVPLHDAIKPVPRDANWMKRHESFNARAKQGDVDLVFLGDSITQGWEGAGKEAWKEHYGDRKAANMGIGGDRTQHVLWRLDNGNIEGIKPKLVVLMIGTNNSNGDQHTAEQIADGPQFSYEARTPNDWMTELIERVRDSV